MDVLLLFEQDFQLTNPIHYSGSPRALRGGSAQSFLVSAKTLNT